MKPNIMRKFFFSPILGLKLRIWISMKARKTIMKKGSFDNYILHTNPKYLNSKFGIYIRQLMIKKLKDPNMPLPIIPGHNTVRNAARGGKHWSKKNYPTIYMPNKHRLQDDKTEYYFKTPQEMSRHELLELEAELKRISEEGYDLPPRPTEEQMVEYRNNPELTRFFNRLKRL